jgi:hypothetical protein
VILIALPVLTSRMIFYFGETLRAFEYAIRMIGVSN